jgi:hypothetical protein
MMGKQIEAIKAVIDGAVKSGLFANADAVCEVMNSFLYIRYAVEQFEREGDTGAMKKVDKDA